MVTFPNYHRSEVTDFNHGEPTVCHDCNKWHSVLQQLGWFDADKLCFVLNINQRQADLLAAASEKYGCDGAELLERMAVDCLGKDDQCPTTN